MLGSQLGIGAYRALVEENLDGHMVSVKRDSWSFTTSRLLNSPNQRASRPRSLPPARFRFPPPGRFLEPRVVRARLEPRRRREAVLKRLSLVCSAPSRHLALKQQGVGG